MADRRRSTTRTKLDLGRPTNTFQRITWPLIWLRRRYRAHAYKLPKWLRVIEGLAIALAVALILREVAFQASWVPSSSMYPTLNKGDFLVVNRLVYQFHGPEAGDIVVFRHNSWNPYTGQPEEIDFIKRCIAVPGEWVMYANGFLYKDDDADHAGAKPFDENYLPPTVWGQTFLPPVALTEYNESNPAATDGWKPFQEGVWVQVPEGKYLMMGDNRLHSADSRFWGWMDEEAVKGKAFVIYMSFEGPELPQATMNLTLSDLPYFLTHIRWDRLMDTVD